jgi:hypothetical protein
VDAQRIADRHPVTESKGSVDRGRGLAHEGM